MYKKIYILSHEKKILTCAIPGNCSLHYYEIFIFFPPLLTIWILQSRYVYIMQFILITTHKRVFLSLSHALIHTHQTNSSWLPSQIHSSTMFSSISEARIHAMVSQAISRKLLMTKEFELSWMTRSFKKVKKSHHHFLKQLKTPWWPSLSSLKIMLLHPFAYKNFQRSLIRWKIRWVVPFFPFFIRLILLMYESWKEVLEKQWKNTRRTPIWINGRCLFTKLLPYPAFITKGIFLYFFCFYFICPLK